jgi:hypothetical protein
MASNFSQIIEKSNKIQIRVHTLQKFSYNEESFIESAHLTRRFGFLNFADNERAPKGLLNYANSKNLI